MNPNNISTPTPEEDAAIQALENNDTAARAEISTTSQSVTPVTPAIPTAPAVPAEPLASVTPSVPVVGQDVTPSRPFSVTPVTPEPLSESEPLSATTTPFNPFEAKVAEQAKAKKSKKPIMIIATILLIAGLAAGGYYAWTLLQPAAAPTVQPATQSEESTTNGAVETPEDVTSEVNAIEAGLNTIDEAAFQDSIISDQTLNQ